MNKIIKITRKNRVAMVEPGDLRRPDTGGGKEGLRLNVPLLPRQTKSVIGSMLEREPVLLPVQWDISDPLACIELSSAAVKHSTGQAAVPARWRAMAAEACKRRRTVGPAHA
jgi:hypothetical protein